MESRIGKYARLEVERRFLLRECPADLRGEPFRIRDMYLSGTRLRLRRIDSPNGEVARKLTQKYAAAGSEFGTVATNIYLNEPEYAHLVNVGGCEIIKDRCIYLHCGTRFAVDVFRGRHEGLILAEAEFETERDAADFALPEFALRDVTHEPFFTGGALAALSEAELRQCLADQLAACHGGDERPSSA